MIEAPYSEKTQQAVEASSVPNLELNRIPHQLGQVRFTQLYENGVAYYKAIQFSKPGFKLFNNIFNEKGELEACTFLMDNEGKPFNVHTQPIGTGAYGQVFVGVNVLNGQPCAMKNVTRKKYQPYKSDKSIFLSEVSVLTALDECQGYVDTIKDSIVFQNYLPGHNLYTYFFDHESININQFSFDERLGIAILFIEKVQALHNKGFMHRDLKLENILYEHETKTLNLCDYGLSEPLSNLSQSIRGAYLYQDPDQFLGKVTCQSEIYSVGVVLSLCFTRSDIKDIENMIIDRIKTNQQSVKDIYRYYQQAVPEFQDDALPQYEKQLWSVISQTLNEDGEQRGTLEQLKQELKEIKGLRQQAYQKEKQAELLTELMNKLSLSEETEQSEQFESMEIVDKTQPLILSKNLAKDPEFESKLQILPNDHLRELATRLHQS